MDENKTAEREKRGTEPLVCTSHSNICVLKIFKVVRYIKSSFSSGI